MTVNKVTEEYVEFPALYLCHCSLLFTIFQATQWWKNAEVGRPSLTPKSVKDPVIDETPPAHRKCFQTKPYWRGLCFLSQASLAPSSWSFWKQRQPSCSNSQTHSFGFLFFLLLWHAKLFHWETTAPLATAEPVLLLDPVTLSQGNSCKAGQTQAEKADWPIPASGTHFRLQQNPRVVSAHCSGSSCKA